MCNRSLLRMENRIIEEMEILTESEEKPHISESQIIITDPAGDVTGTMAEHHIVIKEASADDDDDLQTFLVVTPVDEQRFESIQAQSLAEEVIVDEEEFQLDEKTGMPIRIKKNNTKEVLSIEKYPPIKTVMPTGQAMQFLRGRPAPSTSLVQHAPPSHTVTSALLETPELPEPPVPRRRPQRVACVRRTCIDCNNFSTYLEAKWNEHLTAHTVINTADVVVVNTMASMPWKCMSCSFRTSHWHLLRKHTKLHRGNRLKRAGRHLRKALPPGSFHSGEGGSVTAYRMNDSPKFCAICNLHFQRPNHKQRHMERMHSGGRNMTPKTLMCPYCNRLYAHTTQLEKHMAYCSQDRETYTCTICNSMYVQKASYQKHMSRIHEDLTENQNTCMSALLQNTALHDNTCPACPNLNFHRKCDMLRHVKMVHVLGMPMKEEIPKTEAIHIERSKICITCGKTFQGPEKMRQHYEKVHVAPHVRVDMPPRSTDGPNVCMKCGRVCTTKGNLQKHLAICGVTEKTMGCPICQKFFKSKWDVRNHMSQVHGNHEYRKRKVKYMCEYCEKVFSQRGMYDYHLNKVHLDRRPFVCDGCGAKYYGPQALRWHKLTCPQTSQEREMAQCGECNKIFPSKYHARRHMRTIHEGRNPLLEKVQCTLCGTSMNRTSLYRHTRKQHGHQISQGLCMPMTQQLVEAPLDSVQPTYQLATINGQQMLIDSNQMLVDGQQLVVDGQPMLVGDQQVDENGQKVITVKNVQGTIQIVM